MGFMSSEGTSFADILAFKSPSKYMKLGQRVAVKHFRMHDFSYAFVMNIEKSFINLKFRHAIYELDLFPEDPIVVMFEGENKVFLASGEIVTVEKMDPLTVEVRIDKMQKRDSLRRDERFFVSLGCSLISDPNENAAFGIVKNLSYSGFKINSKKEFEVGQVLQIEIQLNQNQQICCFGSVVRRKTLGLYFEYGIQIEDISKNNILTLQHYINQIKSSKS